MRAASNRVALPCLAVAALLLAHSAAATTRTVCSSGCAFTSIQAAQNASAPGDTIDVRGTVTEQGIVLDRSLTIRSGLAQAPIVQAATLPGLATDRVFYIAPGITVVLQDLVIRNGMFTSGFGGGVAAFGNAVLKRCTVTDCRANGGGGVYGSANLMLSDCTVQYNQGDANGGGILSQGATFVLERSTVALNRSFEGGGLKVSGGSANLVNSTVALNRANNGGGGLFNEFGAVTVLQSCTFAQNSLRAIQCNGSSSIIQVQNSILANSLTSTYLPGGTDVAVFLGGVVIDNGFNIVQSPNGVGFAAPGSTVNQDPGLGPLSDHGGPTRTYGLRPTSIARNTGLVGALTTDQRGFARDAAPDRGAFEVRGGGLDPVLVDKAVAPMVLNSEIHYGEFRSVSVRGPSYVVGAQSSNGTIFVQSVDTTSYQTYMGTLHDLPGAIAAATCFGNTGAMYYHLQFEDGREWQNDGGTTGALPVDSTLAWPHYVPLAGATGSQTFLADVGVDVPNARYISLGSNATAIAAAAEHSILATNLVYARQCGLQFRLGPVILRASPSIDPYIGWSRLDTLLTRAPAAWATIPQSVDVVVVLSPSDAAIVLGGNGLAGLGTAANPKGFSACDPTPAGDFSRTWRHEVGHNFSVNHFDGGAPEGGTINSANKLAHFSGPEQRLIERQRTRFSAAFPALASWTIPTPPMAATDQLLVSATAGGPWDVNVLANDHDANGDAFSLTYFSPTSSGTVGGTLSATATNGVLRYQPPASPGTGFDVFTYRIRDTSGLEAVGRLFVRVLDRTSGHQYVQDFSGYTDSTRTIGDGSFFTAAIPGDRGAPEIIGGALELAPDAGGKQNGFTLPAMFLQNGFQMSFRYRVSSAGTPADGFVIGFGPPTPLSTVIANQISSYSPGLQLEFNTFTAPGLHVRVNDAVVANGNLAVPPIADGAWHQAQLTWTPLGGLGLGVDGTARFYNLPVPGFTPTSSSVLSFFAFNGGLSENVSLDDIQLTTVTTAGVGGTAPLAFALRAPAPNPFVGTTRIGFELPRAGSVRLRILDLQGRHVRELIPRVTYEAGRHSIDWNGEDDLGHKVPPGVYLERIELGGSVATRRVVSLR